MEKRLGGRELHCPVCRAEVDEDFLVCPVCTTRLRQACAKCGRPLEAALAGLPLLRDADRARRRARRRSSSAKRAAALAARACASYICRGRMALEQTLILAKPDAVERNLAGEILARFERRGLKLRAARLVTATPRARRDALRRAQGEAVLRRARRLHHLRARRSRSCSRAKARSRPAARRSARRTRPTRIRARCAATSRSRCRTTSCTAPTRPSRPSARSGSGSPMASSGLRRRREERRALDADERASTRTRTRPTTGRSTRSRGASGRSTSPS